MSRKIGSIKGFEPTFLSDTRGKWLVVTTKSKKPRTQASFDDILKKLFNPNKHTQSPSTSFKNKQQR